jgi:multiple sugar transport system substrate-binding protein
LGKKGLELVTLAAVAVFVFGACGSSSATQAPQLSPIPSAAPVGTTVVRWFVGLGKGNDLSAVAAEKLFVRAYNASGTGIYINLEIVPSASARATLKAEIANGVGPDIVGPVGDADRIGFSDAFMDLTPQIASSGMDTSRYSSVLMNFFVQPGGAQIGLPYLINPGFIFYNKDIFTRAGLPDLPTRVGDQWNGQDWTWDTLATVAAQLTLDKNGKKSTDTGFDPANIVQYGLDFPWTDARRMASSWAAGSLVDPTGAAAIPDAWTAAWSWYYDAIWKNHIAPSSKVFNSALLNYSSTVSSGRVAMALSWPWAIGTYGSLDAQGHSTAAFSNWDMAVLPTYNSRTSSPIDADTFVILKGTANPAAAFTAMLAIMANKNLQAAYGGMPVATADQVAWFAGMDSSMATIFPNNKVSWSVLQEMENYPSNPGPDAELPNGTDANQVLSTFFARLQGTSGLDMANEISNLQSQLNQTFTQASASPGN